MVAFEPFPTVYFRRAVSSTTEQGAHSYVPFNTVLLLLLLSLLSPLDEGAESKDEELPEETFEVVLLVLSTIPTDCMVPRLDTLGGNIGFRRHTKFSRS